MFCGKTTKISFRLLDRTTKLLDSTADAKQMTRTELLTNYITEGLTREKTGATRTIQDNQPADS